MIINIIYNFLFVFMTLWKRFLSVFGAMWELQKRYQEKLCLSISNKFTRTHIITYNFGYNGTTEKVLRNNLSFYLNIIYTHI